MDGGSPNSGRWGGWGDPGRGRDPPSKEGTEAPWGGRRGRSGALSRTPTPRPEPPCPRPCQVGKSTQPLWARPAPPPGAVTGAGCGTRGPPAEAIRSPRHTGEWAGEWGRGHQTGALAQAPLRCAGGWGSHFPHKEEVSGMVPASPLGRVRPLCSRCQARWTPGCPMSNARLHSPGEENCSCLSQRGRGLL